MERRKRVIVLVLGALMAAVIVLGTIDTLVWSPLSLASGVRLSRIYSVLVVQGDLPDAVGNAVAWLLAWSVLCSCFVLALLPARRFFAPVAAAARPLEVVASGALVLAAMACSHWWSAFAMDLSVSDTLPPYTGGTSPFGSGLLVAGVAAGLVGLLLAAVALARRRTTRIGPA